jgi:hypothetical protein
VSFPVSWELDTVVVTSLPEKRLLPKIALATWDDSRSLGGFGQEIAAVTRVLGASRCIVREIGDAVEATFRRPEVFGTVLLDSLVADLGAPCALVLDVFDDDRVTIRWSVGTAAGDPFPYLIEPDNYAQQEIDVASGSATVGTISVLIIDPAQTPGDQQSGWMTQRLSDLGLADIQGRRCRLRRFISEALGFTVIADGPAGTPTLDSSYAAFGFEIRDTRDTERKITAFNHGGGIEGGGDGGGLDPTGMKSLVPDGVVGGYGLNPDTGLYLLNPAVPVTALWHYNTLTYPGEPKHGHLAIAPTLHLTDPVIAALQPTKSLAVVQTFFDVGLGHFIRDFVYSVSHFTNIAFLWRAAGSSDAWHELTDHLITVHIRGETDPSFTPVQGISSADLSTIHSIEIGDDRKHVDLPTEGQSIECFIVSRAAPTQDLPVYLEGMTAGQLAKDLYDGLYSDRDVHGNVKPSGIIYDPEAVLAMTTPVRARLITAVTDLRDWLEKYLYAPLGMAPALDRFGQVSPVSQVPPIELSALPVIANAITESSSDWNAGDRIINILRFTYGRDYKPGIGGPTPDADGLLERSVLDEFRDEVSIDRNGEQILEITSLLFTAIGASTGKARTNTVTGLPDEGAELGNQLAQLRGANILNRYSLGAAAVSVACMRSATALLRTGDWVLLDLSWMPDYLTQRRGLLAIGQIVSLGDLDCAWRQLLVEQVVPLTAPGYS